MRARSWRGEQRGPYTVVRRWRWASAAARVLEAFNTRTGAPALLLRPGRPGDWAPAPRPWSATVHSTPQQLAVELEGRADRVALEEVTLALHRLGGALAQVDTEPAAQSALVGEVARARRAELLWRRRWRARPQLRVALAAVVVLAALVALVSDRSRQQGNAVSVARGGAAQLAPAVARAPVAAAARPKWTAVALPMPPEPFQGQLRPNREGKCAGALERAINGGCWIKAEATLEECRKAAYEWKGGCYVPVYPTLKEPQAALRGNTENP